jgi:transcriptional regulator with XRE-family HTH domain
MTSKKKLPRIDDQLRAAIKASGLTQYGVAKLAEVSPEQIYRFMSRERDLKLSTAANLAAALGLTLR